MVNKYFGFGCLRIRGGNLTTTGVVMLSQIGTKLLSLKASISDNFPRFGMSFFLLVVSVFCTPGSFILKEAKAGKIDVYNYHISPPYVVGPNAGLSHDFIKYLNQQGQGVYSFKLTHLPRKRLDRVLDADHKAVVLWVSPDWFGENSDTNYSWTSPLMVDRNVFLSSIENPVEVKNISNLKRLLLGGILGYRYEDLDAQANVGQINRANAINEGALMRLVAGQQVDVGIMAQSVARYMVRETGIESQVYFGAQSHSVYARRLLVSGYKPRLQQFLDKVIMQMANDPEWIKVMAGYGLKPAPACIENQVEVTDVTGLNFREGNVAQFNIKKVSKRHNRSAFSTNQTLTQRCPAMDVEDKLLLGTQLNLQEVKS